MLMKIYFLVFACFPYVLLLIFLFGYWSVKNSSKLNHTKYQYEKSYIEKDALDEYLSFYIICAKIMVLVIIMYVVGLAVVQIKAFKIIEIVETIEITLQKNVLQCFGLILTLCVVLVALKKDYYLIFNYIEILSLHCVYEKLITCGIILLLSPILSIIKLECADDYFWTFLCNLVISSLDIWFYILLAKLFYIVTKTVFSNEQSELKILNSLYLKKGQKIGKSNLKDEEVSDSALIMNMEYLFDEYIKAYKKEKKQKIDHIVISSVFDNEEKLYDIISKKILWIFILWGIVAEILYFIISKIYMVSLYKLLFIEGFILFMAIFSCGIIIYIKAIKEKSTLRYTIDRFFFHDYVIRYEIKDKSKFIPVINFWSFNKSSNFIKAYLNMIIFYKILDQGQIKMERLLKQLKDMYLYHEELGEAKGNLFYLIYIHYSFLYYCGLNKNNRKKFIRQSREQVWIKGLENPILVSMITGMIEYTEGMEVDCRMKAFRDYKRDILQKNNYHISICRIFN